MAFISFVWRYLIWHYTTGVVSCLRLAADFLWFIYHFFSFSEVVRTLGAPWRRLGESYRVGFHPERMLEAFIVNTLMRLFGLVIRLGWLTVAILALLATFALGLLMMLMFLTAPIIIVASFVIGFYLLFLV